MVKAFPKNCRRGFQWSFWTNLQRNYRRYFENFQRNYRKNFKKLREDFSRQILRELSKKIPEVFLKNFLGNYHSYVEHKHSCGNFLWNWTEVLRKKFHKQVVKGIPNAEANFEKIAEGISWIMAQDFHRVITINKIIFLLCISRTHFYSNDCVQ